MSKRGRISRIPLGLLGAALVLPAASRAQAARELQALDSAFAWAADTTPGCAIGVQRAGHAPLLRAYGMANLSLDVPFTPATVIDAASVAKSFTAGAVLLLAHEGRLSLDDTVRKYLPELPPYASRVTIRHLLSHQSGMRESQALANFAGLPGNAAIYSNTDVLGMAARQRALNFTPGTESSYSNTSYVLAAFIVQRVSGMPFVEFTRTRIFDPLGMRDTRWNGDGKRITKRLATGYRALAGGGFQQEPNLEPEWGSGGLLTTVGDLLRWNEALRTGSLLPRTLVTLMETPARLADGRATLFGLGLEQSSYRGIRAVGHGGASGAGYRAAVVRYPEQELSMAVLCNERLRDPRTAVQRVADAFLTFPAPPPAATVAAALPPYVTLADSQLRAMSGVYRDRRGGTSMRITVSDSGWHFPEPYWFGPSTLRPHSPTTFSIQRGVGRGEFIVDRSGAPTGFRVWAAFTSDTLSYRRVPEWRPARAELEQFVGRYRGDETDSESAITVQGEGLMLLIRAGRGGTLTPETQDAFTWPLGLVEFRRDGTGRVTGFVMSSPTARGVLFERR